MKLKLMIRSLLFALLAVGITELRAQDVADPLTQQGMEHLLPMNARMRSMGGTGVAVGNDAGAMFSNPASLAMVTAPQVQVGGKSLSTGYEQTQRWTPNRFYADMSLMFENKLDGIKDPDVILNPTDKIHRPFDNITPDWKHDLSNLQFSSFAASMPFMLFDMQWTAGIGGAEMVNLNHYYQNNNAIDPVLGQYRPTPIPLVTQGDTLDVDWYQFIRQREGSIYGITPALSVNPFEGLYAGFSVAFLTGTSDDNQWENGRGAMRLLYNAYLLDSLNKQSVTTGTSTYSGVLPTLGLMFEEEYYTLGISLQPPVTITRKWDAEKITTTNTSAQTQTTSGTDKLDLPWFYTLGVALRPTEKWNIGIDYAIRNYSDAVYKPEQGNDVKPWVGSKVFRVGAEYRLWRWMDVRFGAREEAEAFAPVGEGLIGEPAKGAVYSFGFGFRWNNMSVNVSNEFGTLRYNDMWQSNVNTNKVTSYTGVIEIGYQFK